MTRYPVTCAVFLSLAATVATTAAADEPEPARASPCEAAEHRAFDFWIGEWEVRGPDGGLVGHNRIRPILDGCVLLEEWSSAGGSTGKSFNLYDRSTGRWHQTWVDSNGLLLEIEGGLDASGAMVLEGSTVSPQGGETRQRITWTPTKNGTVRQVWESSGDGGATWKPVFDGLYVRTKER